jgi:hypothetical protein
LGRFPYTRAKNNKKQRQKKRKTCAQVRKLIVKINKKREEVGKKYIEYEELVKKAIKLETLNEMD